MARLQQDDTAQTSTVTASSCSAAAAASGSDDVVIPAFRPGPGTGAPAAAATEVELDSTSEPATRKRRTVECLELEALGEQVPAYGSRDQQQGDRKRETRTAEDKSRDHLDDRAPGSTTYVAVIGDESDFRPVEQFYEQDNVPAQAAVHNDSSVACGRTGCIAFGEARHLQVRGLQIQEYGESSYNAFNLCLKHRHYNRIESTYNASNLSLKHRHDNRIEKLVRLADIEFTASLEGQAGVKGLAVGAWLVSEFGAVKAALMEYKYKERNDDDQDDYMSLTTLLMLTFTLVWRKELVRGGHAYHLAPPRGGFHGGGGACSLIWGHHSGMRRHGITSAAVHRLGRHIKSAAPGMRTLVDSTSGRHGHDEDGGAETTTAPTDPSRWQVLVDSTPGKLGVIAAAAAFTGASVRTRTTASTFGQLEGTAVATASRVPSLSVNSAGRPAEGTGGTALAAWSQVYSLSVNSAGTPTRQEELGARTERPGKPGLQVLTKFTLERLGGVAAAAALRSSGPAAGSMVAAAPAPVEEGSCERITRTSSHCQAPAGADTLAEEFVQYNVATLRLELRSKGLLSRGLKDHLVRRHGSSAARDGMSRGAWRVEEVGRGRRPTLAAVRWKVWRRRPRTVVQWAGCRFSALACREWVAAAAALTGPATVSMSRAAAVSNETSPWRRVNRTCICVLP